MTELCKNICHQKALVEEMLIELDIDYHRTRSILKNASNRALSETHLVDKQAVKFLKSEAYDEIRMLSGLETKVENMIEKAKSLKDKVAPNIESSFHMAKIELDLKNSNEKHFNLDVGFKSSKSDNLKDAIFLKNAAYDPTKVTLSMKSSGIYLSVVVKSDNKNMKNIISSMCLQVTGIYSRKVYESKNCESKVQGDLLSNEAVMIVIKPNESCEISVQMFGSNVRNSPLMYEKVH